jgi:two-component system alkaline phosphatase synthesis response regulator PhoP
MRANRIHLAHGPANTPFHGEPKRRQRILVVEDDAVIRRLNTEILISSGYEADAAENGAVAWDGLQLMTYDLVITDNDMPKVTGVELLQRIQAACMVMPVIMATGTPPDEELVRNRLTPPAITILKPYSFSDLLAAVNTVLHVASDLLGEMEPPPNWQMEVPEDRRRLC